MKVAYADPPYPNNAHLYKKHKDFAGEVDHEQLIHQLTTKYPDGWALSTSARALQFVLSLCPSDVLVLSWVKKTAPPMGDGRIYSWEPVIINGGRRPQLPTRMSLLADPPQYTFRPRPLNHVIGEKPQEFCFWVFQNLGLVATDTLDDLYNGSGAVKRAWEAWKQQTTILEAP